MMAFFPSFTREHRINALFCSPFDRFIPLTDLSTPSLFLYNPFFKAHTCNDSSQISLTYLSSRFGTLGLFQDAHPMSAACLSSTVHESCASLIIESSYSQPILLQNPSNVSLIPLNSHHYSARRQSLSAGKKYRQSLSSSYRQLQPPLPVREQDTMSISFYKRSDRPGTFFPVSIDLVHDR